MIIKPKTAKALGVTLAAQSLGPRRPVTGIRSVRIPGDHLSIETWKNRIEERVLQQTPEDLPLVRLRLFERAGNVGLGRDLTARDVLQSLESGANGLFLELLTEFLLTLCLWRRHKDIAEQRLHVADHAS